MKEHVRPCSGKLDVECKFIPSFLDPKRHQVGSPLFFHKRDGSSSRPENGTL